MRAIRKGDWRTPALIISALATMAMGVLLTWVGRWLTFWFDEWSFIFDRQTLTVETFLRPHADGLNAVPAAVYFVLVQGFGLGNYYPYLLVDWLAHFVCVGLLGYIVTRKSGVLVGLMAALSLLFLGCAYEALLQPFQMQYLFSIAGGLIAFILLDRPTRSMRDYVLAGVALLIAIASSGVGPIISGMVLLWALLRRDRAAALVTVPSLAAYGFWYFAYWDELHRVAGSGQNLPMVPLEIVYGIGAAVVGVIGLPPARLSWLGVAIAVAVLMLLAVIATRRKLPPTPLAVAAVAALFVEFILQAVFRGAMGFEHGARSAYLYPAGVFIWLAIAGTIGHRLDPREWTGGRRLLVPAAVGLLVVPMILGNMIQFMLAARAMEPLRATELRELALIEDLRNTPGLALDEYPDPAVLGPITPAAYFKTFDRFGEPRIESGDPAADLPGPDTAALNALVARLLGGAVRLGPDGPAGPTPPELTSIRGTTAPDFAAGCTTLTTLAGEAQAMWSPPTSGVAIHTDGKAIVQVFLGVFEPADAAINPMLLSAVRHGDTFWLPGLPASLSWTLSVTVQGDATLHICSRR